MSVLRSKYPRCGALLAEYVKVKLAPVMRGIKDWTEEWMAWEEAEEDGKDLVKFFARWTECLYEDHPERMRTLHDAAARENGVEVAYVAPAESTFYFVYGKQRFDLTFAVLVIRAMMLQARPAVADSVPIVGGVVNSALLEWMEALLDKFPMSVADVHTCLSGARLACMGARLAALRGCA